MKIAIIGAGFAGLAAGKHLRTFGHDVTIFEKCPDVGGVWSRTRRYPGLCTQNNKDTYYLSDLKMPHWYPEWPSGAQVQAYLEGYAAMFGLNQFLRLSTKVCRAEPIGDGRWQVTTAPVGADGQTDGPEQTEDFDFVVVANGIFCDPAIPQWPGREEFEAAGGQLLAPSEVLSLDQVADKDIAVVGYGKSACDVAASLSVAARSTTVIARSLLWKMPRMLMGVLNFKHLMLTRLGEALFEYQTLVGVEKFMHTVGKPVTNSMLGSVQQVATKQLKLAELGLVPAGSFERIARSTVSLVTEGFYEAVAEGRIEVLRDSQITELTSIQTEQGVRPAVRTSTGQTVAVDRIICATGFRQDVPFLPAEVQDKITDERGNFELYRQILPHDVPGLAFCGYNSSFFSPLSAEAASIWIGAHLMGELNLPPVAERRRRVAERLRWMEKRTEGHHARGTNIIPFSMHNVDEILSDVGIDVSTALKTQQWVRPPEASDYRGIPEQLLDRHERRTGERLGVRNSGGLSAKAAASQRSAAKSGAKVGAGA